MNATEISGRSKTGARRGRPVRQPTGRNLELYHELVCERRPQALVAARFRISQPRVAQIRRFVAAWIEKQLPAEAASKIAVLCQLVGALPAAGFGEDGRRFHFAIAMRRVQLEAAYGEYLSHFGGERGTLAYGQLLAADDAGDLPAELKAKLRWPRELIDSAVRMARELADLGAVAARGPFGQLPQRIRQTGEQPAQTRA